MIYSKAQIMWLYLLYNKSDTGKIIQIKINANGNLNYVIYCKYDNPIRR